MDLPIHVAGAVQSDTNRRYQCSTSHSRNLETKEFHSMLSVGGRISVKRTLEQQKMMLFL